MMWCEKDFVKDSFWFVAKIRWRSQRWFLVLAKVRLVGKSNIDFTPSSFNRQFCILLV